MEQFLEDYGLVWVGSGSESDSSAPTSGVGAGAGAGAWGGGCGPVAAAAAATTATSDNYKNSTTVDPYSNDAKVFSSYLYNAFYLYWAVLLFCIFACFKKRVNIILKYTPIYDTKLHILVR